ncbi:MAG: hypothetical protein KA147_03620 [Bacteroidia bacterium]|nr:hypothetical protein [Bacteroidia bacterium]
MAEDQYDRQLHFDKTNEECSHELLCFKDCRSLREVGDFLRGQSMTISEFKILVGSTHINSFLQDDVAMQGNKISLSGLLQFIDCPVLLQEHSAKQLVQIEEYGQLHEPGKVRSMAELFNRQYKELFGQEEEGEHVTGLF